MVLLRRQFLVCYCGLADELVGKLDDLVEPWPLLVARFLPVCRTVRTTIVIILTHEFARFLCTGKVGIFAEDFLTVWIIF